MYARQTPYSKSNREIKVPGNYSGNAFRDLGNPYDIDPKEEDIPAAQQPSDFDLASQTQTESEQGEKEGSTSAGLHSIIRRGSGGIGFEELLILGLVFLISQNDSKDDLAFLLLLLLFIQ